MKAEDVTWSTGDDGYSFVYTGASQYTGEPQTDSVYATYRPFDENGEKTGEPVYLEISPRSGRTFRDVGDYIFEVDGVDDPNYTFDSNSLSQDYSITPREVWIEASDYTDTLDYGDSIPAFKWNYMGKGDGKFYVVDGVKITVSGYKGNELIAQGSEAGDGYVTRVSLIESSVEGMLKNYTINGVAGENWRSWVSNADYEGTLKRRGCYASEGAGRAKRQVHGRRVFRSRKCSDGYL